MKHWMLALAAVLPASAAPAAAQDHLADFLVITGRIDTGFDGISSAGITASINGEPVAVDEDGRFEARLHQSPYYQVRFEDETIHTAIQTFGIADLYRTDCECLRLPAPACCLLPAAAYGCLRLPTYACLRLPASARGSRGSTSEPIE